MSDSEGKGKHTKEGNVKNPRPGISKEEQPGTSKENPQSSASESEKSVSSWTSAESSDSDHYSSNGTRRKKAYRKKKDTEPNRKSGKLPKLLNRYEDAFKGLAAKLIVDNDPDNASLLTYQSIGLRKL